MTHLPLLPPAAAARPFVWLTKSARTPDRATEHLPHRPAQLAPVAATPGLWRRWADASIHEPSPPPRRSGWSLTNARLRASLHQ